MCIDTNAESHIALLQASQFYLEKGYTYLQHYYITNQYEALYWYSVDHL